MRNKESIRYLRWFDILIITIILWAEGICTSAVSYLALMKGEKTIDESLSFSASDNYSALALQAALLFLALLYLWFRHFDFSTWKIWFNLKALLYAGLIFLAGALIFDIYTIATAPIARVSPFPGPIGAFFGSETVSSVIYAMLNGVYEELYFLGICLSVKREHLIWTVPFSLIIRVSFHTYQGIISALGIGIIFGIFMFIVFYKSKDKNLLPFFIAHALADIFGLGIISYLGIL